MGTSNSREWTERALFVWEPGNWSQATMDKLEYLLVGKHVAAVHAMPHESIYSYGDVSCLSKDKPRAIEQLEREFRHQASSVVALHQCSFEILFGDRVQKIVAVARRLQVEKIVMSRFKQSSFSKWIHGDLNEKLEAEAPCPVFFLESEEENPFARAATVTRSKTSQPQPYR